jgi:uncharacterized delta-60 repeat protein
VLDLGSFSYALAVGLGRNGKLVIAGSQSPGLRVTNALVARLTRTGALDRSFNGSGYNAKQYAPKAAFSSFDSIAMQRNGDVVVAGSATSGVGSVNADALVVRFTPGGGPDRSFGAGGVALAPSARRYTVVGTFVPGAGSVAVTPQGEVLAAGQIANGPLINLAVWAFTASGRAAQGFGSHGVAKLAMRTGQNSEGAALALDPNGKLVVAGDENPPARPPYRGLVARLNG